MTYKLGLFAGLDIEPARLVTARLVNTLARLVIQTSQQTSLARLAKKLEPVRLARELNHKNTVKGIIKASEQQTQNTYNFNTREHKSIHQLIYNSTVTQR